MYKIKLKIISCFVLTTFFFSSCVAPALAAVTYTYDSNGNMTSDGTKCYVYNQANQLKQVKTCSNSQLIAEYSYDYNGNRIIKKQYSNGVLQKTIYSPDDGYQTVKQASNGATQNTTFYQVNDEVVAQKNPDGTIAYNSTDHLGSSAVVTSQTGTVVEKTGYEPYGEVKSGGTLEKFQYTGQEKDQETGLNYYGARYYDPHLQHFTQPDDIIPNPYDPQSLNRYSYVENNPIKYTDPTGHFLEDACIIECTALYLSVVASAPDTEVDTQFLAQDASDFLAAPSVGKGVAVGLSALSVVAPDVSIGKGSKGIGQVIDKGIRYYNNMTTLRKYEGRAGDGMHWGHIVEQNKYNLEKFGKQQIHNTLNLVKMPAAVNRKMNA